MDAIQLSSGKLGKVSQNTRGARSGGDTPCPVITKFMLLSCCHLLNALHCGSPEAQPLVNACYCWELLVAVLVGGRVRSSMGEETCEVSGKKTPCLYKYTYFMREMSIFIYYLLQERSYMPTSFLCLASPFSKWPPGHQAL